MAINLSGIPTSLTFDENTVNSTPQLLYSSVTFTDPDGGLNGRRLSVSGLLPEDLVAIDNEGSGSGQIGFASGTVSYGNVAIGTVTGGAGATLTVTFNANATAAAVEALVENLTYANTSGAPTSDRTLTVALVPVTQQTGSANPFNALTDVATSSLFLKPMLADLDGDRDLDVVMGEVEGTLLYFKNTGTATAPVYVEQTTAQTNPFFGIDVGDPDEWDRSVPTLADVDRDGDLDAVVGNDYGRLLYFKNTGTATAPQYVEQTTAQTNPFAGINVRALSAPALADADGDGDLDAVVGSFYGTLQYYKNTGGLTGILDRVQ